jgi:hypothetical protein
MLRHDTLIQILENGALHRATEDSHFVASFAESAGQAQTWTVGSNQVHSHSSATCYQCQILRIVGDGLRKSGRLAAFSISPERYGCAEVVVRNPVQCERRRRPGHKAR